MTCEISSNAKRFIFFAPRSCFFKRTITPLFRVKKIVILWTDSFNCEEQQTNQLWNSLSSLGTFWNRFFLFLRIKPKFLLPPSPVFFFVLKKSNVGTCFKTHWSFWSEMLGSIFSICLQCSDVPDLILDVPRRIHHLSLVRLFIQKCFLNCTFVFFCAILFWPGCCGGLVSYSNW